MVKTSQLSICEPEQKSSLTSNHINLTCNIKGQHNSPNSYKENKQSQSAIGSENHSNHTYCSTDYYQPQG
jgi:hypothetical protein